MDDQTIQVVQRLQTDSRFTKGAFGLPSCAASSLHIEESVVTTASVRDMFDKLSPDKLPSMHSFLALDEANDDNEDQNSPVALATRNDSGIVRVPTPNPVSQQNLGYCVLLKKLNIFVPSQIFNQCYI